MSAVFDQVEAFLIHFCPSRSPLLLALSGGPDSLCLFYALLLFRKRHGIPFHIAHVDHGWRQESRQEAQALHQLALQHQVPFHLKVLNPTMFKGNLEAACREERYNFFAQLCQKLSFQGVLTGHHQDDQAETVFKRLLEGSHWSRWVSIQPESEIKGVRILRPLLGVTKNDIQKALLENNIQAFEDPTNRHLQFLRARLRETIFPRLNEEFGKQIQNSMIRLGKDAQELIDYFDMRLAPLLAQVIEGPWGICLDLQMFMPIDLLEIKYLLRILCKKEGFFLSREILEQAAHALQLGKANQFFAMGSHQVWIDRQRVFIMSSCFNTRESQFLQISPGHHSMCDWKIDISEDIFLSYYPLTSWKEAWRGHLQSYVPIGNYRIGFKRTLDKEITNIATIKKRWNQAKIPAFLYHQFPLILEDKKIYHEFLTGKPFVILREGIRCWKVKISI